MTRKSLPVAPSQAEGLGLATVMDRELATRFGRPYVTLAAFAIDVDRIRVTVDEDEDAPWPFGWEVFITELELLRTLEQETFDTNEFVDLLCASVFQITAEGPTLGGQLVFSVYDALARGALSSELRAAFLHWRGKPTNLVEALAPMWADADATARTLAARALGVLLEMPLAPTTREALERFANG